MIRKIGKGSYSGDWYGIAARQRLQAFFNNASIFEKIVQLRRCFLHCRRGWKKKSPAFRPEMHIVSGFHQDGCNQPHGRGLL